MTATTTSPPAPHRAGAGPAPTPPPTGAGGPAPARRAPATPARAGSGEAAATWLPVIPFLVFGLAAGSWWVHLSGHGLSGVLVGIAQLTGLGASVAALTTVVTMARVPVLVDRVGADRVLRWHRWSATATMVLLTVHVITSVLGYAAIDTVGIGEEIGSLLTSYPDMLTATVATALLVAVSVSSIRRLRRRFRYQTWLFLHWYSYLAVALSFGHTLSDGASFVGGGWASLLWTWLHLVVAGLVLWYRLFVPAVRIAFHPMRVDRVENLGNDVVSLTFKGRNLDEYHARGGQHVRLRFLTRDGWWQSHPMSLSARPTPTSFRVTVVRNGDHTAWMQTVRPGTRVVVSGVYGHLTPDLCRGPVVLIGGGSGIAPLRALLEELPAGADVRVVQRAHDAEQAILANELATLAHERGTHVDLLLGARADDPAQDVLAPAQFAWGIPDLARRTALVCGSAGFVDTVVRSLRTVGVPPERIHTERFDA